MSYEGLIIGMTTEEQKAIERDLVVELKRRAINQKIAETEEELVARDILPEEDLGAAHNEWSQSGVIPSCSYGLIYSGQNPEERVFGIYGVKDETITGCSGPFAPAVTNLSGRDGGIVRPAVALKFELGVGAKVKDIWQIQRIYPQPRPEGFTATPIIYNKKEYFRIYAEGRNDANASGQPQKLVLLGKVVEPKGVILMGAE